MNRDRRQRKDPYLNELLRRRGISPVLLSFLDEKDVDRLARSWDRATWDSVKSRAGLEHPGDAPNAALSADVDHSMTWLLRTVGLPQGLAARLNAADLKLFATAFDREMWKEFQPRVERAIIQKRGFSAADAKRLSEDPRNLYEIERRLEELVIAKRIASGSSTSINPVYLGKHRPTNIGTGHPGSKS